MDEAKPKLSDYNPKLVLNYSNTQVGKEESLESLDHTPLMATVFSKFCLSESPISHTQKSSSEMGKNRTSCLGLTLYFKHPGCKVFKMWEH